MKLPAPGSISGASGCRGLGLVELFAAISLFAVGTMGFVSAALSANSLHEETRARMHATQLARRTIEAMQSVPFGEVFQTFNRDASDDPDGVGTALGGDFDSQDLASTYPQYASLMTPPPGGTEEFPFDVQIDFPVQSGSEGIIRENMVSSEWPSLDINGDGAADASDHSGDYVILPVKIQVDWMVGGSPRQILLPTFITR